MVGTVLVCNVEHGLLVCRLGLLFSLGSDVRIWMSWRDASEKTQSLALVRAHCRASFLRFRSGGVPLCLFWVMFALASASNGPH
jgi:hypothetical protein